MKSINAIRSQLFRIIDNYWGAENRSRIELAKQIADRYEENISRTATYRFDDRPYSERIQEAVNDLWKFDTPEQANQDRGFRRKYAYANTMPIGNRRQRLVSLYGKYERQYPRSVYMGRRNNRS